MINDQRKEIQCRRGEIWYANLGEATFKGEQSGLRPVLIIQNDTGNTFSPTTIIAPITGQCKKIQMPTHIKIKLMKDSIILLEQIRIISKRRLSNQGCIYRVPEEEMKKVDAAIKISLGMEKKETRGDVKCKFEKYENGMKMVLDNGKKIMHEEVIINEKQMEPLFRFMYKILKRNKENKK